MMKRWLFLFLLIPVFCEAQELKRQGADSGKILETHPVNLVDSAENRMSLSLLATDSVFFIRLEGTGTGANTIVIDDKAIFLLDNDSTVTVFSKAIQGYEQDDSLRSYRHEYAILQDDLELLGRHNIQALRKYSVMGHHDIYLNSVQSNQAKDLVRFFITRLAEAQLWRVNLTEPAFPGGTAAFLSFLNRNLKELPVTGTDTRKPASLQFRVSADGSVDDIRITQSAGILFDNELLRILKRMPKWKPALKNGKPVNRVVTQAISFLEEDKKVRIQFST